MAPYSLSRRNAIINGKTRDGLVVLECKGDNFSEFMDISPSAILQQKAMINIANDLPCTLSALKKVQGVGRKTIDRYSDDILKIVREYVLDLKKAEK